MLIYQNLAELKAHPRPFGLAMGVFDGVHLGHQQVIAAAQGTGDLGVLTFEPHPVKILAPERAPTHLLTHLEHKKILLAPLGVHFLVVLPFTPELAQQKAQDFAHELFQTPVKRLTAGTDWSFGLNRQGTMPLLARWASTHHIDVLPVPAVNHEGTRISSTRIRHCLQKADLTQAAALLGRPFSVYGQVIQGQQLGRTLGFPTANLNLHHEFLPPNGVYLVTSENKIGLANIGHRPTLNTPNPSRTLEVHFPDATLPFTYGWSLELSFLEKIRDEIKFPNLAELTAQIHRDLEFARSHPAFLANSTPATP